MSEKIIIIFIFYIRAHAEPDVFLKKVVFCVVRAVQVLQIFLYQSARRAPAEHPQSARRAPVELAEHQQSARRAPEARPESARRSPAERP
jgi:hypothetical protein